MMEMPCGLEGRSLICAPRSADAARAAQELPQAERALIRMSGLGSNSNATTEPKELRLSETSTAMERFRRQQPASTAPAPTEPGLDLREMMGRMQQLLR
jgi:cytosine/adenosine deaminase-related metal-dependent hydrolase